MFGLADHTFWRINDRCAVLVNGFPSRRRICSWCRHLSTSKPDFVRVTFKITESSQIPLPLDNFNCSYFSAFSFNQSLKSIKVGLLQFRQSVCVEHTSITLVGSLLMASLRSEALDNSCSELRKQNTPTKLKNAPAKIEEMVLIVQFHWRKTVQFVQRGNNYSFCLAIFVPYSLRGISLQYIAICKLNISGFCFSCD